MTRKNGPDTAAVFLVTCESRILSFGLDPDSGGRSTHMSESPSASIVVSVYYNPTSHSLLDPMSRSTENLVLDQNLTPKCPSS